MRKTKQREVILEELRRLRTHPSAEELYGIVRKRLPRVSLGTVYRNLEMLSREGTIGRLDLGVARMRFDGNPEEHQHIRCIDCGRIEDVTAGAKIPRHEKDIEERTGYRVLERRISFVGICPGCRKTAERSTRRE